MPPAPEDRWWLQASCANYETDYWFPGAQCDGNGAQAQADSLIAKSICAVCPVQAQCLDWGVRYEIHGIWGGASSKERERMRRQRKLRRLTPGFNLNDGAVKSARRTQERVS